LQAAYFYYISNCNLLSELQNLFALFYQLIECRSSFAVSWIRMLKLVT